MKILILTRTLALILFGIVILVTNAFAWDRPFNNSANWGGTGLMEIPNARILEDGMVRFGGALASPYRWITGSMGILPGIEFSGRLTAITNISSGLSPEYGSNKDKALDFKYQILPESKQLPAIAFGMHDFWGTGLFTAEYLVVSRQYFPFDFTLGVGSKRLKGLNIPFTDTVGFFGGMEWALSERFHFIAEYNPIKYEIDKTSARGVPEGAKSPVNIGLRVNVLRGINIGLSYQRGDTLGLMLNIHNELGEPVLPFRPDPGPLVSIDRRPFNKRDQQKMIEDIHHEILKAGFSEVTVYTDGSDLIAEFENTRYLANQKAAGRVLRILLFHSPEDTNRLVAVLKKSNISILKVSVKPDHMEKYLFGEISQDIFFNRLIDVQISSTPLESHRETDISVKEEKKKYDYSIDPDLDIYWNDPSEFFQYRVGIDASMTVNVWKGAFVNSVLTAPLYSNIDSPTTESLPHDVVRSDAARYLRNDFSINRLLFNQTVRISERTFGRLSLGYFESVYAGIGGELLYFPGEGGMAFGIEGDWVRKRVPGKLIELMDVDRHSILGNFYYYYPEMEITFHTQYGRFLAGDIGWMFDFSRRYRTGVVLGMFVSFTDTDGVEPSFNSGYNHKGIYLRIPIRTLLTHDSPRTLTYGTSPWSRDVGQTVSHWQDLFSLAGELMPARFKARLDEFRR